LDEQRLSNMMTKQAWQGAALLLAGVAGVSAQELRPAPGFWVRAGATIRMGYKVDFRDTAMPAPTGAGEFSNGFVLPSVSTNSPLTWNWGYQDASQVQGNTLRFDRMNDAPRVGRVDGGSESTFGGEIRAGFEALRFEVKDRQVRFGIEAGYSFGSLSMSASGSAQGTASYTAAGYSLLSPNGEMLTSPGAPYAGTFAGPGPLISRTPLFQQTSTGAGTSTLDMGLDADLHTFKLGPYFDIPLSPRWTAGFSFGYCTVLPDAEFRFTEVTEFPGTTLPSSRVSRVVRRSDWQPGGYFEIRAHYDVTRRLSVFAAGEFLYNETLRFGDGGREAQIKMGGVYGGSLGARWAF